MQSDRSHESGRNHNRPSERQHPEHLPAPVRERQLVNENDGPDGNAYPQTYLTPPRPPYTMSMEDIIKAHKEGVEIGLIQFTVVILGE